MINQMLSKGNLEITDEVVSMIVLMCLKDIEGIEIISHLKDDLRGMFHKRYYKGVLIDSTENELKIILKLEMSNPKNIIDTCLKLQKMLVDEIRHMTGIVINNITIKVDKVYI